MIALSHPKPQHLLTFLPAVAAAILIVADLQAQIPPPTGVTLTQWNEGQVVLKTTSGLPMPCPLGQYTTCGSQNATHYRIYLSSVQGQLGTLAATVTPMDYPDEPAVFNAPKGHMYYATVRGYNTTTGQESTNTDQYPLQMYEILNTGYKLSSFFHEPNTQVTWAIGVNKVTGLPSVLKSTDYFSTYSVIKTFQLTDLNYPDTTYLTFYIDHFGVMFVSARPLPLMSRDGGATWTPISTSISYMSPSTALMVPGWSITDSDYGLLAIAEYGGYGPSTPNNYSTITPHRRVLLSSDPTRQSWTFMDFPGRYKHVHSYQINPYNTRLQFLSLGDALDAADPTPGSDSYGYFVSTDGGISFGGNVLQGWHGQTFWNGPTTTTFFPDQRSIASNDSNGMYGYLWPMGRNGWSSLDNTTPSLIYDIYPALQNYCFPGQGCGYPMTLWSIVAVRGSYEAYGVALADNLANNIPMPLFRYDGVSGTSTIIAGSRSYDAPFRYISVSNGNIIPSQARYFFIDGFGGMRVPRIP